MNFFFFSLDSRLGLLFARPLKRSSTLSTYCQWDKNTLMKFSKEEPSCLMLKLSLYYSTFLLLFHFYFLDSLHKKNGNPFVTYHVGNLPSLAVVDVYFFIQKHWWVKLAVIVFCWPSHGNGAGGLDSSYLKLPDPAAQLPLVDKSI